MKTNARVEIPYRVMRSIRRYKSEFQAEITRLVAQKLLESNGIIKPEEIGECAANVIFGEDKLVERQEKAMEETSLKAYHRGDFRYLDELLAEWRNEQPGCAA